VRWAWAVGVFLLGFSAANSHAQQVTEIYRCVDAEGRRHYTNTKRETGGMKCELVTSQVNVAPPLAKPPPKPPSAPSAPSAFPRETAREGASARERQREILQKELASEEQALSKARQALSEQEAVRSGEERNDARVEERQQPYKDSDETHQKNVEALKRELANLNR
jgi:type IV secretory pathway VirB10-like protein